MLDVLIPALAQETKFPGCAQPQHEVRGRRGVKSSHPSSLPGLVVSLPRQGLRPSFLASSLSSSLGHHYLWGHSSVACLGPCTAPQHQPIDCVDQSGHRPQRQGLCCSNRGRRPSCLKCLHLTQGSFTQEGFQPLLETAPSGGLSPCRPLSRQTSLEKHRQCGGAYGTQADAHSIFVFLLISIYT